MYKLKLNNYYNSNVKKFTKETLNKLIRIFILIIHNNYVNVITTVLIIIFVFIYKTTF